MSEEIVDQLRMTIGPLHYEFHAHDAWGLSELAKMREHFSCQDFAGKAGRVLHLADLDMNRDGKRPISTNWIPAWFKTLLPARSPRRNWILKGDDTGYLILKHEKSRHSLWIRGAIPTFYEAKYQLPWALILEDITTLRGGIMHGGLITQDGNGIIITAPPGGGKTTMISKLSNDWSVYADDACLLWPEKEKIHASPLPTWSVLLGRSDPLPSIESWKIGSFVTISLILLIKRGYQVRNINLKPRQAVMPIYRALSEQPSVIKERNSYKTRLFNFAYDLANRIECRAITTTLYGSTWDHFDIIQPVNLLEM